MAYSIEHVSIRCRDLDASAVWFERMFGAKIVLRRALDEDRKILFLRIGESLLELMSMGPGEEPPKPMVHYGAHHIGIRTEDFDASYKDLKEKGAEFLCEPFDPTPGIRLVFLREPNGAVIELAYRDPAVFADALEKGAVDW